MYNHYTIMVMFIVSYRLTALLVLCLFLFFPLCIREEKMFELYTSHVKLASVTYIV